MQRRRVWLGPGLALLLASAWGGAVARGDGAASPSSGPLRYTLPNGLLVVLDPMPERSTVAVVVTVDVGTANQPDGWTGLAHLTEHLMFDGTPAADGEYLSRLERLGMTSLNATTSRDRTRYYEVVPRQRLERVLWLEADRFAHAMDDLDPAALQEQVRVLDREREQRNLGREAVWDLVSTVTYADDHPYARNGEDAGDVHAIGVDDVRWFFQTHYMPDRMTLSLAGGFDVEETRGWIERYFGPLRRGPIAAPEVLPVPARVHFGAERRVLAEASRSFDQLTVIWSSPVWGAEGDAELDFVARSLQRRLRRALVRNGGARTVSVTQYSATLASEFRVFVSVPRRSGTLAPLQALDDELAALRAEPMPSRELDSIRGSWLSDLQLYRESALRRAQAQGTRVASFPGGVWDHEANLDRYRRVTGGSVRDAVRRYLGTSDRLVVSLAGRVEAPPEGRIVSDMVMEDE